MYELAQSAAVRRARNPELAASRSEQPTSSEPSATNSGSSRKTGTEMQSIRHRIAGTRPYGSGNRRPMPETTWIRPANFVDASVCH